MRLIDADKLKIRETWALVENVSNTPNGISFAPLSCVLKKDIDDAPTIEYPFYQEAYQTGYEEGNNERPQGEWKYICSYANTHLLRYECSKCGRTVDVYKRQELLVKYPFCHCGADMRKGGKKE